MGPLSMFDYPLTEVAGFRLDVRFNPLEQGCKVQENIVKQDNAIKEGRREFWDHQDDGQRRQLTTKRHN